MLFGTRLSIETCALINLVVHFAECGDLNVVDNCRKRTTT